MTVTQPKDEIWLRCLGCGYNLTGICTPEQKIGRCPECGKRFNRRTLKRLHAEVGSISSARQLVIKTFLLPVFLLLLCVPLVFAISVSWWLGGLVALGIVVVTGALNIPIAKDWGRARQARHAKEARDFALARDPAAIGVLTLLVVSQLLIALGYGAVLLGGLTAIMWSNHN